MTVQCVTMGGFAFHCRNRSELNELYRYIFEDEVYRFSSDRSDPFIVDCGSHIGVSILYFKMLYPEARILAFEPEPTNFRLLQRNVQANDLTKVTLVNAAVSSASGVARYYGEISGASPETLGNSIDERWGNRGSGDCLQVATIALSDYVEREVDYLKLNIEGAELDVLREVQEKLPLVRQIYLQYHETRQSREDSDLEAIKKLFRDSGFDFQAMPVALHDSLRESFRTWYDDVMPRLWVINASQRRQ